MKNALLYFILLTSCILPVSAQTLYQLDSANADCYNAIEILSDTFGPTTPPTGIGHIMEINADKMSLHSFEREHNTVWYKFTAPNNCLLTFSIIPISKSDDYDFLLYRADNDNFCEEIMTQNTMPLRTNISKSSNIDNGRTGLSIFATDTFVHSGPGPIFSSALEVTKDEIYYLVVDNFSSNGSGHSIIFNYRNCSNPNRYALDPNYKKSKDDEDYDIDNPALDAKKPKINMTLNVVSKVNNAPLKATIDILNFKSQNLVGPDYHITGAVSCTRKLVQNRKYVIKVTADGYFPATKEIFAKTIDLTLTASLQKIERGKNIIIDDIYFYGNTEKFLSNSTPALKSLLQVMEENPSLKIKIDGHVNWPKKFISPEEEKFNMDLSWNRARAVYEYLIKNGIDKKRLDYEGFSNTKMIYPHPSNEEEAKQNRRVEIEVLAF